MEIFWMRNVYMSILSGILLLVSFWIARAFYYLYGHPLGNYPGPKLWAATRLCYIYHQFRGDLIFQLKTIHEQYGPVVRIAPDELSFTSSAAWKDLYGQVSRKQLPWDPFIFPPKMEFDVMTYLNNEEHSRVRRQLAYAFSNKALEGQQPLIQAHIDTLIKQLRNAEGIVDIAEWFTFATFDIIGDLAFAESFGNLEKGDYHPFPRFMIDGFLAGTLMSALHRFGLLGFAIALLPPSLIRKQKEVIAWTEATVTKRLNRKTDRPDFISYMLKADKEDRTMTRAEILGNSWGIAAAGGDTTATHLSGTVYQLCRDPPKLKRAASEVRTTFKEEKDITMATISQLPYLHACLEEGLRVCPPAPFGFARRTTEPTMIAGVLVPANTSVAIPQYAAWHSQDNFERPDEYIPERWLSEREGFDKDKRDAFHPFGIGPRNCIGQNLAYIDAHLILARVLWNFDMELADLSFVWTKQKASLVWQRKPLMVKLKSVR